MEQAISKQPSPFYELLQNSEVVTLFFPSDRDEGGPFWDSAGNLDLARCDEEGEEEVSVINLGGNRYRLTERNMGPLSSLRLNWGDEFLAKDLGNCALELLRVAMPSPYKHYKSIISGKFDNEWPIAKLIHQCEGGWETVAMGLLTITIPIGMVEKFERESAGMNMGFR